MAESGKKKDEGFQFDPITFEALRNEVVRTPSRPFEFNQKTFNSLRKKFKAEQPPGFIVPNPSGLPMPQADMAPGPIPEPTVQAGPTLQLPLEIPEAVPPDPFSFTPEVDAPVEAPTLPESTAQRIGGYVDQKVQGRVRSVLEEARAAGIDVVIGPLGGVRTPEEQQAEIDAGRSWWNGPAETAPHVMQEGVDMTILDGMDVVNDPAAYQQLEEIAKRHGLIRPSGTVAEGDFGHFEFGAVPQKAQGQAQVPAHGLKWERTSPDKRDDLIKRTPAYEWPEELAEGEAVDFSKRVANRVGEGLKDLVFFIPSFGTFRPGRGNVWDKRFWNEAEGPLADTLRELLGRKDIRKAAYEGDGDKILREINKGIPTDTEMRAPTPYEKWKIFGGPEGGVIESRMGPVGRFIVEDPVAALVILLMGRMTAQQGAKAGKRIWRWIQRRHLRANEAVDARMAGQPPPQPRTQPHDQQPFRSGWRPTGPRRGLVRQPPGGAEAGQGEKIPLGKVPEKFTEGEFTESGKTPLGKVDRKGKTLGDRSQERRVEETIADQHADVERVREVRAEEIADSVETRLKEGNIKEADNLLTTEEAQGILGLPGADGVVRKSGVPKEYKELGKKLREKVDVALKSPPQPPRGPDRRVEDTLKSRDADRRAQAPDRRTTSAMDDMREALHGTDIKETTERYAGKSEEVQQLAERVVNAKIVGQQTKETQGLSGANAEKLFKMLDRGEVQQVKDFLAGPKPAKPTAKDAVRNGLNKRLDQVEAELAAAKTGEEISSASRLFDKIRGEIRSAGVQDKEHTNEGFTLRINQIAQKIDAARKKPKPPKKRIKIEPSDKGLTAYSEKESLDPETGEPGVLRSEWRIRKTKPGESNLKPFILERRYIRRGKEEPWELVDDANKKIHLFTAIPPEATPVSAEYKKDAADAAAQAEQRAKALEEKKKLEQSRQESREKQAVSEAAFKRLRESTNPRYQGKELTQAWVDAIPRLQKIKGFTDKAFKDPAFRKDYDAVMNATTVPAKAKALKKFLANLPGHEARLSGKKEPAQKSRVLKTVDEANAFVTAIKKLGATDIKIARAETGKLVTYKATPEIEGKIQKIGGPPATPSGTLVGVNQRAADNKLSWAGTAMHESETVAELNRIVDELAPYKELASEKAVQQFEALHARIKERIEAVAATPDEVDPYSPENLPRIKVEGKTYKERANHADGLVDAGGKRMSEAKTLADLDKIYNELDIARSKAHAPVRKYFDSAYRWNQRRIDPTFRGPGKMKGERDVFKTGQPLFPRGGYEHPATRDQQLAFFGEASAKLSDSELVGGLDATQVNHLRRRVTSGDIRSHNELDNAIYEMQEEEGGPLRPDGSGRPQPGPGQKWWSPKRWKKRDRDYIVSRDKIIKQATKALGVPYRIGKIRNPNAAAIYTVRDKLIRAKAKYVQRIDVAAHEIGHWIHDNIFGTTPRGRLKIAGTPLLPFAKILGNMAYPGAAKSRKAAEGLAEYVSWYVTNPARAKKEGLGFHDYFVKEVMGKIAPEINEVLLQMRYEHEAWMKAGWLLRIKSQIVRGQATKAKVSIDALIRSQFEKNIGFQHIADAMAQGRKLDADKDLKKLVDMIAGATPEAESWMEWGGGQRSFENPGEIIGRSYKEIIHDIGPRPDLFEVYYVSSRALIRLKTKGWSTEEHFGIAQADAEAAVRELKSPEFDKAVKELTEYFQNLIRYLDSAGRAGGKFAARVFKYDPVYAPVHRVWESEAPIMGHMGKRSVVGGKISSTNIPVGRFKGSDLPIASPIETGVQLTFTILKRANEIDLMNRIVDAGIEYEAKNPGRGTYIEGPIGNPVEPVKIPVEWIRKKLGITDLEEGIADEYLTFFKPSFWKPESGLVRVWRGDKFLTYQIHPELYRTVEGLHSSAGTLLKSLFPEFLRGKKGLSDPIAALTRIGRAGVILTPRFALRAIFKDLPSVWMRSKHPFSTYGNAPSAAWQILTESPLYIKGKAARAGMSTFYQRRSDQILEDMFKQVIGGKKPTALRRFYELVRLVSRHPVQGLEKAMEMFEFTLRLAEMMSEGLAAAKTREEMVRIGYEGRNIILDFSTGGEMSRAVNPYSIFYNARMVGLWWHRKTYQKWADEGQRRVYFARLAVLLAAPGALVAAYNLLNKKNRPCYLAYPQQQKDTHWIVWFPNQNCQEGDDPWRFPKPHEVGHLGTVVERVAEAYAKKDPAILAKMLGHWLRDVNPIPEPTLAMPLIEGVANYDFYYDRKIFPRQMEGLIPELRASYRTSETFKIIGAKTNLPPAQLEHIVTGMTNTLGWWTIESADKMLELMKFVDAKPGPTKTAGQGWITGAFRGSWPRFHTEASEEFWDLWSLDPKGPLDPRDPGMSRVKESVDELRRRDLDTAADEIEKEYPQQVDAYDDFNDAKKEMREIMSEYYGEQDSGKFTPDELRKKYDAAAFKYTNVAIEAVNSWYGYDRYEKVGAVD